MEPPLSVMKSLAAVLRRPNATWWFVLLAHFVIGPCTFAQEGTEPTTPIFPLGPTLKQVAAGGILHYQPLSKLVTGAASVGFQLKDSNSGCLAGAFVVVANTGVLAGSEENFGSYLVEPMAQGWGPMLYYDCQNVYARAGVSWLRWEPRVADPAGSSRIIPVVAWDAALQYPIPLLSGMIQIPVDNSKPVPVSASLRAGITGRSIIGDQAAPADFFDSTIGTSRTDYLGFLVGLIITVGDVRLSATGVYFRQREGQSVEGMSGLMPVLQLRSVLPFISW